METDWHDLQSILGATTKEKEDDVMSLEEFIGGLQGA